MRTALSRKRTTPASPSLADVENGSLPADERADFSPRNNINNAHVGRVKSPRIRMSSSEESAVQKSVLGLLKDAVFGIAFGSLFMAALMLLDYCSVVNLETARVFRQSAAHIFSSSEIIESIGDEAGKKVVLSAEVYNAMKNELSDSREVMNAEMQILEARSRKVTSLKAELGSLRVEYDKLMHDTGLDAFCPECDWGMRMNCQQRVNYMLEQYSDTATTIDCIAKLVSQGKERNGKCIRA